MILGGGEIDGVCLIARKRRRHDLPDIPFKKDRDDVAVGIGFVAGPERLLPARRQDRQHDQARFAALLDFAMPVEAGLEAILIEPDLEAFGSETLMHRLGESEVGAGVADEGIEDWSGHVAHTRLRG